MDSCMNESSSSFRHYWLTLQLVLFGCIDTLFYASTRDSFHHRKFQFVVKLTRTELAERID